MKTLNISKPNGDSLSIGAGAPLAIIAGPCVIEGRDHCLSIAERLAEMSTKLNLPLIFKASYDKANRTSAAGHRGLGMEEGLAILAEVKKQFSSPVISDIHLPEQASVAAEVLDVLQIPAFLCRQSDLLEAAGKTKKPVMIKKGQFLHPDDMQFAAQKVEAAGSNSVLLCERGSCFGYRELIVDFRSLAQMSALGYPVVFDATHSVQVMGGKGGSSGGNRFYVPFLARAAVAAGVDAVFLETHPTPDTSPSDGSNMIPLDQLEALLTDLQSLDQIQLKTRGMQG